MVLQVLHVEEILSSKEVLIYDSSIRERVESIIYEQMRKYKYLFEN